MKPPQATGWKTKLFGDTRTNFYGWLATGLLVIGASLWFLLAAFRAGASRSPTGLLLIAIYLVLLGHFGIALQTYHSRVAKSLDAEGRRADESPSPNKALQRTEAGGEASSDLHA